MMMTVPIHGCRHEWGQCQQNQYREIFVHGHKILPTTPTHPNDLNALPSIMAFQLKSKSIPMSKGFYPAIPTRTIEASTAPILIPLDISRPTIHKHHTMIEIQTTVLIMISIPSSDFIMRMKVQLITYQRDRCSFNC